MEINGVTGVVVDSSITVHSHLGPGLLESAYHACLAHELRKRGLDVLTQVELPIIYDGIRVDIGYRVDLVVESLVLVEIKAVKTLLPIHEAQLLSYLQDEWFLGWPADQLQRRPSERRHKTNRQRNPLGSSSVTSVPLWFKKAL